MTLYEIKKDKLDIIKEKDNILEKDIQKIVGDNLKELMGFKFIEFEFQVSGKRIDILAFDEELNAPVIIELKRNNDKGLFDQGMEYFNILLDRDKKHVFLTTLADKLNIKSDIKLINWENSRVVFIGKNFTQRQMRAIDFKGIPIEIWDYNLYKNNFFELEEIGLEKKVNLDIDFGTNNSIAAKVKKEFKEYDLEYHFKKGSGETVRLFNILKDRILFFDDVKIKPVKVYIGFKVNDKLFMDVEFLKKSIKVTFWGEKKVEEFNFIRNIENIGTFGNGTYQAVVDSEEQINYLIPLLKKSYEIRIK